MYSIVKGMKIADSGSVKNVENLFQSRLRGDISASAYENQLKKFTNDITAEILASASLYPVQEDDIPCPKCDTGLLKTFGRVAKCNNPDCGHYIFRQFCGLRLDHDQLLKPVKNGMTDILKGFRSFKGNLFKARVIINSNGDTQVSSKTNSTIN